MIGLFANEKHAITNEIDVKKIEQIIDKIKYINDNLCHYVIKLYYEYSDIISENNVKDINEELKHKYKNNIIDIKNDIQKIKKCNLIISPSHSDTYDYNDDLWKGNVFSKLLKENVIENLIVYGIPKSKINNSLNDIPVDIKEKIKIKKNFFIRKEIKEINPQTVFISIDIDCLDTRKKKYSSLEYCPMTILSNLSRIDIKNKNDNEIIKLIKDCIFVKNDLGYSNLYRVGENTLNIKKLIRNIKKVKKYCIKNNINLGIEGMYADISEVSGYDYSKKTIEMMSELIDELI